MIINKITIELYQEADNEIGSEHVEIIVNPSLIGLFDKDKITHYYTFKSEYGFSFEDKKEIDKLFEKVKNIVNSAK